MDYKALKWSVHDNPANPGEPAIGVITLNRPERLNAVDPLMRLELDTLCNEIARNSIVKVVIITGAGRGFCAGGDLISEGEVLGAFEGSMGITGPYKEMAEYFFNDLRHRVLQSAMRKLEDLPQVTIAAINGPAPSARASARWPSRRDLCPRVAARETSPSLSASAGRCA
jgi:enoyl-CoA hydratase/carnithine racemase